MILHGMKTQQNYKKKEKEIEILKSQLSKSCEGCKHKLRKIQEILNSKDKKC